MLQHDIVVLTPSRDPVNDQVRDRAVRGLEGLLCAGLLGFGDLDVGGQLLGVGEQLVSLRAASPSYLLAQRLVFGTQ